METFKHKVKWQVSLSNGETFFEGKGDYQDIQDGRPSPWQRLNSYLVANNLKLTSLSLYTDDNQTFQLPSAGKNPKFKEFGELPAPYEFNFFRKVGTEVGMEGNKQTGEPKMVDWYTCIEASYFVDITRPKKAEMIRVVLALQLWVDEMNPKNCWVLPQIKTLLEYDVLSNNHNIKQRKIEHND